MRRVADGCSGGTQGLIGYRRGEGSESEASGLLRVLLREWESKCNICSVSGGALHSFETF